MRSSSLSPSLSGTASTHFRPVVMVSACASRRRSFSGERRSDSSGKKLKIGSSTLRISPRSIAIPRASDATLFDTDFMLCSVSASKVTLSTRRPLISSEPLKYRSNTSLPRRATRTACTLALEATSRSAILHSAPRSMSLSSLAAATGQPSSRATGTPQPSGGSAYTGNAGSGASAASFDPPGHTFCGRARQHDLRDDGIVDTLLFSAGLTVVAAVLRHDEVERRKDVQALATPADASDPAFQTL